MTPPELPRVWIVSQGEYSDYHPLAACPSKGDAEKLASRVTGQNDPDGYYAAFVESLPIVPGNVSRIPVLHLTTRIRDDGTEHDYREYVEIEWPWGAEESCSWSWRRGGSQGYLAVFGYDHERVRKVFSDQRGMLMADDAYRAESRGGQR